MQDGFYLRALPNKNNERGYPLPAKKCEGRHRGRPTVMHVDPELGPLCLWCGHWVDASSTSSKRR